jgi:ACT domain-containing protein
MDREALTLAVSEIVLRHLPTATDPDAVSSIVADLVRLMESEHFDVPAEAAARLAVVTVLGKNHSGIVHAFSEVLAEQDVDIVDINQTIVHGNFAMMMIVDPSTARGGFNVLKEALKKRGDEVGVLVYVQYEDIMRAVNRI